MKIIKEYTIKKGFLKKYVLQNCEKNKIFVENICIVYQRAKWANFYCSTAQQSSILDSLKESWV